MDKRKEELFEQIVKDEYLDTPIDYGAMIIEMVEQIGKSDYKFLKQVYTIIHRHMKKRGS